jgi:alpha-galactosidase
LFAAWGVDYLKYDNCYAGPGCDQISCADGTAAPATERYAAMRDALLATGRPITFSICSWGTDDVSRWAAGYGNLWRTTGDIRPTYASMLSIFHATAGLGGYAGAGGWNDPDMLETGNGMTADEDRTGITLWAMMAAPLIAGTDLVHAKPATIALLTNRAVIAVDQDPLGRPARLAEEGVLVRPLAGGDTAVALVNETGAAATMSAAVTGRTVTDLWSGTTTGTVRAVVPAHGAALFRVTAW